MFLKDVKNLLLWADKNQVKVYRSKTVPVWSVGDAFPEAGKTPFYFLIYSGNIIETQVQHSVC